MFNYPNLIKQLPAVKSVYMDHPWDDGTCPCDPKHERHYGALQREKVQVDIEDGYRVAFLPIHSSE